MRTHDHRFRRFAFVVGIVLSTVSTTVLADPPARVARLGLVAGAVSFSPAGESEWDRAIVNRPLTTGDRLWAEAGARAEIEIGGALLRLDAGTGLSVINLDDRVAQFQLTQGSLNVRVRRLAPDQVFEVDTPNLAFTLRAPGAYRISVDPDRDTTTIVMRSGRGEAFGDDAAYVIDARRSYRFAGTDLRDVEGLDFPSFDEFDRWSGERDRRYDDSISARYVSSDVLGYQDLDAHGTWRIDANYGNVWTPNRVPAGWSPYRDGHWAWIDPWGWTWVDDAPWGFAVSHYGRWAHFEGSWGWVPGPVRTPAYYAPALVVFIGGSNFQLTLSSGNVGGVAWFPLGPREVYRPAYPVSRGYYENVNRSNTVINNTLIQNTYNTTVTNIVYANRQVSGAVIGVPTTTFLQSQPVARAAVQVAPAAIAQQPLAVAPPVPPTQRSVRGAMPAADTPPARVFERPVIARTAPPRAHPGFAAQEAQLAVQPGKPLDDTARKALKPSAVAAPLVKVVPPQAPARAVAAPPVALPARPEVDAGLSPDAPDRKGPRAREPARAQAAVPSPTPTPSAETPAARRPENAPAVARESPPERARALERALPTPRAPEKKPEKAPDREPDKEAAKGSAKGADTALERARAPAVLARPTPTPTPLPPPTATPAPARVVPPAAAPSPSPGPDHGPTAVPRGAQPAKAAASRPGKGKGKDGADEDEDPPGRKSGRS